MATIVDLKSIVYLYMTHVQISKPNLIFNWRPPHQTIYHLFLVDLPLEALPKLQI